MPELLWPLGAVVSTLLFGAWREAANGNRRDAALLGEDPAQPLLKISE